MTYNRENKMDEPIILHEDKDILVVMKPSGLQVHAARVAKASREPVPTLVEWLLPRYPEIGVVGDDPEQRTGIVHRLDKETSGVMLVARNAHAFGYLKSLFQKHEIKKTYRAVVFGTPKEKSGIVDAPIGIRNGTMKRSVRFLRPSRRRGMRWSMGRSCARCCGWPGRTWSRFPPAPAW